MKKNDYITSFVLILASIQLFISASSTAADNRLIERLDLDKDGQVTIKESVAAPSVLASFGKIDTDGNGKISSIELAQTKVLLNERSKKIKFDQKL